MLRFGKLPERGIKSLAAEAVERALDDAAIAARDVQSVWFSNSGWGMNGGQDCIRGQVALRPAGIDGVPFVNVENACAGGATALYGATLAVQAGAVECALAIGVEKLFQRDRLKMFASFIGGLDVEQLPHLIEQAQAMQREGDGQVPEGWGRRPKREGRKERARPELGSLLRSALVVSDHYGLDLGQLARKAIRQRLSGKQNGRAAKSPFMDVYAIAARRHMQAFGSTERQLAAIAAKNHRHGSLNPLAQVRRAMTLDEVLADDPVSYPLTRSMCAPIGDGAAAAIVCSERFAREHGLSRAVRIRAAVLASGRAKSATDPDIAERAGREAYERAALGPSAIHVAELHDATAFGELHQSEALGFCERGRGGELAESGATGLGGKLPLNPSGGLECRGHPIGASGLAQIHEIVSQLRGEAGERQVARAQIGLTQNGGGFLGQEEAAMGIFILEGGS
jgi:acetyl-CoA acyltransferase